MSRIFSIQWCAFQYLVWYSVSLQSGRVIASCIVLYNFTDKFDKFICSDTCISFVICPVILIECRGNLICAASSLSVSHFLNTHNSEFLLLCLTPSFFYFLLFLQLQVVQLYHCLFLGLHLHFLILYIRHFSTLQPIDFVKILIFNFFYRMNFELTSSTSSSLNILFLHSMWCSIFLVCRHFL